MPYTPTTPTLVLCQNLVDALLLAWTDKTADDGVDWDFFARFTDGSAGAESKVVGRQVRIFPVHYDNGPSARGEDEWLHDLQVLTVERYPKELAGLPAKLWVAERVDWVNEFIVGGFDFSHDGPPSWNRKLVTLSANVSVCDTEKLVTGGKLFYSLAEIQFSEIRNA